MYTIHKCNVSHWFIITSNYNGKDFIRITCTEKYDSGKKSEEPQSEKVGVESEKSSVLPSHAPKLQFPQTSIIGFPHETKVEIKW